MAHTFQGKSVNIFFNALFDESDELTIIDKETGNKIKVDVSDILNFVAQEYVLPQKLNELENASAKQLLLNDTNNKI